MRDLSAQSENLARKGRFARRLGALIGVIALLVFGVNLGAEPHFVDESAYFSQSYFAELFASGERDDIQWLSLAAYDLPPFPKYLIGGALWLGGYKTPGPNEAKRWYDDTSSRFEPPGALVVARLPMVMVGAIGCVAIYAIGLLVSGRLLGVVAATLLMVNPLYRMQARRAMSDAPADAFLLVGLALFLWCWKRWLARESSVTSGILAMFAGLAFGLSISSKFSGALGLMVVVVWVVFGSAIGKGWKTRAGLIGSAAVAGLVAAAVFIALNPFLNARPRQRLAEPFAGIARMSLVERVRMMADLRLKVSASQQRGFSHNAVKTPYEKVSVTTVQGFGRFGPLGPSHSDSTRRFDRDQDWGAFAWLPFVAIGAFAAFFQGRIQRSRNEAPTAWAALLHFAMAVAVVTAYLPMAWDRYMLPIQSPAALLGAIGGISIWETLRRTLRGGPRGI